MKTLNLPFELFAHAECMDAEITHWAENFPKVPDVYEARYNLKRNHSDSEEFTDNFFYAREHIAIEKYLKESGLTTCITKNWINLTQKALLETIESWCNKVSKDLGFVCHDLVEPMPISIKVKKTKHRKYRGYYSNGEIFLREKIIQKCAKSESATNEDLLELAFIVLHELAHAANKGWIEGGYRHDEFFLFSFLTLIEQTTGATPDDIKAMRDPFLSEGYYHPFDEKTSFFKFISAAEVEKVLGEPLKGIAIDFQSIVTPYAISKISDDKYVFVGLDAIEAERQKSAAIMNHLTSLGE